MPINCILPHAVTTYVAIDGIESHNGEFVICRIGKLLILIALSARKNCLEGYNAECLIGASDRTGCAMNIVARCTRNSSHL